MTKLFREVPPKELLETVFLQALRLSSLEDSTWFSKSSIAIDELEQVLPLLEAYYMPCKAKEFLHTKLTSARAVTILRQLLIAGGYDLTAKEKTCGGVKGMWYQISAPKVLSTTVTIDFT
jgi:hypothetical protein